MRREAGSRPRPELTREASALAAGARAPRERAAHTQTNASSVISWSAPEYRHRERGPYWYLAPGGTALAFILLGILIQSYFFVAFVALAGAVVMIYAVRPPRTIAFRAAPEGIWAGRTLYKFSEIKSFWIFNSGGSHELSLEVDRIALPYQRLPLGDLHPNKIRAMLSEYLPEREHRESVSDTIADALRF